MRYLILALFFATSALVAEPSVYGGASSYASAKKNRSAIISLQQEVSQLKQEIEGLRSVLEGLSLTVNEMKQQDANSGGLSSGADAKLLQDLGDMIDRINSNYVTKEELQKALKSGRVAKSSTKAKEPKSVKEIKTNPKDDLKKRLEKAKSKDLYSRGVRLVKQKKYSLAKLRFDILKKRGYKKASTHFYLGEIAYRTKNYQDAINYYKISAQENESANYMDKLLLHTGISLQKIGKKSQAERFFQAVVDGYPDSSSAKLAKKYL